MTKTPTSTKRLALACAMMMALSVVLHGNVLTARAQEPATSEASSSEAGSSESGTGSTEANSGQEGGASTPTGGVTFEKIDANTGEVIETIEFSSYEEFQKYCDENGITILTSDPHANDAPAEEPTTPPEPPKPEGQIVAEDAEKDLKDPNPVADATGTPARIVNTGEYNSFKDSYMKKVAEQLESGNNVVFINRYNKKNHVILIPAGTTLDPEVEWFGPEYMSAHFIDITEEYEAQDKSLSHAAKIKNILDARAATN